MISDDMIARFVSGKISEEETKEVFEAAVKNHELAIKIISGFLFIRLFKNSIGVAVEGSLNEAFDEVLHKALKEALHKTSEKIRREGL